MRPPIFICYRRDDAASEATSIRLLIEKRFGKAAVRMDVTFIPPGADWQTTLDEQLELAGSVVAVIGPGWWRPRNAQAQPGVDWVRREISTALKLEKPIIPVLVRGAAPPVPEEIPEDMRRLTGLQAIEVRQDYFESDFQRVLELFEPAIRHDGISSQRIVAPTDPALVFEFDRKRGWKIRNIGGCAAFDVLVTEREFEGDWRTPIRIPDLAIGQERELEWINKRNVDVLGVRYRSHQDVFSTVCQHDKSVPRVGSAFPDWSEEQIRAGWTV